MDTVCREVKHKKDLLEAGQDEDEEEGAADDKLADMEDIVVDVSSSKITSFSSPSSSHSSMATQGTGCECAGQGQCLGPWFLLFRGMGCCQGLEESVFRFVFFFPLEILIPQEDPQGWVRGWK